MNEDLARSIFEAKQLLRPAAMRQYRELQSRASWSADMLREYSTRQMRALVEYAVNDSPFYAEHLRSDRDDLGRLPILTRQHLIDRFDDIRCRSVPESRGRLATTGGSTGAPVRVLLDNRVHQKTMLWRTLASWGVHPADNCAVINRQFRSARATLLNNIMWFPTRRGLLNAAMMTPDAMRGFAQNLVKLRPRIIVGYAGGVLAFANFLKAERLVIPKPDAVWVTASPLTAEQRQFIGKVFGAPVFDQYGSMECSWIATECREHFGLHVAVDCRVVEVVDETGTAVSDGTWGRIIVTDLLNRVFPLIRYEIGDVGRFLQGECSCGSRFPRLDYIRGRVTDVFRFADGSLISGEYLTSIFDDAPKAALQFRVHQVSLNRVNLYCVPRNNNAETLASIQQVARALQERIGNRAHVSLLMVDTLDNDRGKTRFVISDVRSS